MACFIIPVAEAVITTVAAKIMKNKEKKLSAAEHDFETTERIPFYKKLGWLSNMLWGGSALLCFEHIWHGEVVPYFPFLTAASDAAQSVTMLREMATVGGAMAIALTTVWAAMLFVTGRMQKKSLKARPCAKQRG